MYTVDMKLHITSWIQKAFVPSSSNRSVEARAIYFASGMAVLSLLLAGSFFLVFGDGSVPIFGAGSLGTVAIIVLSTLAASIGYFYAAYQARLDDTGADKLTWKTHLGTSALAFVHAAITMLLMAIVFYVVSDAFMGLELDGYISRGRRTGEYDYRR